MTNIFCQDGKVVLLQNFVTEQGYFNEAIGDLRSLHFVNSSGPSADTPCEYAIVDFPSSTIPTHKKLITGMQSTCVPIPIVSVCC